jgi:CspA family cold shock protein
MKTSGTIKWFDKVKGYGFIAVDGREKDIFFHAKQWNSVAAGNPPVDGEHVNFTITDGPKGPFAVEITRG